MGAERRPSTCQGRQVEITGLKTGHQPAKVGRLRTKGSLWLKTGHQPAKVGRLRTWPSTCQGRQVESTKKSVVQPAKVGRSMATFSTCHIWLVCPSVNIYNL